jgi:hypothetical protein
MAENYHQPGAELRGSEFDAADLRWGDDVSRDADDEQISQTLIEHDFCRHPGIGASQNDRERLLALRQFGASCLVEIRLRAAHVRGKPAVTFLESLECVTR